jgi:hypothetical protein
VTKLVRLGEPKQRRGRDLQRELIPSALEFLADSTKSWEGKFIARRLALYMTVAFPELRGRITEFTTPYYSDVWPVLASRVCRASPDGLWLDEEQARKVLWEAVSSPDQAWNRDLLARYFIQLVLKDVLYSLTPRDKRELEAHIYRKRIEAGHSWGNPAKDIAECLGRAYGIEPRKEGNGADWWDSLDRRIRRDGAKVRPEVLASLETLRIQMHLTAFEVDWRKRARAEAKA